MATKKKPSAAQLAARAKFIEMVRSKSKAKKSASKKAAPKKSATHKDTKSHNVNIRVVSGIGSINLNEIGSELLNLEFKINKLKAEKKAARLVSDKKMIQSKITILTNQFKALKLYLNTRAKYI